MPQLRSQRRMYIDGSEYRGQQNTAGDHHGYGVYKSVDGDTYAGSWINGARAGKGVYKHRNGTVYRGKFLNGEKHGHGTWKTVDGHKYMGNWRLGKREGQGTYVWPNGNKYIGKWMNDEPTGEGVVKLSSRGKHEIKSFHSYKLLNGSLVCTRTNQIFDCFYSRHF